MAQLTDRKSIQDYIEKKYVAPWKVTVGKLAAVQAELARARQKFAVAPPAGATETQIQEFNRMKAETFKVFGFCDKHLAKVKSDSDRITQRLAKFKQYLS